MTVSRRKFLTIAGAALLAPTGAVANWHGRAFGAEARISLRGPAALTEPVLKRIEGELHRIEALFSLYDPASALSRLNTDGALSIPATEMVELLQLCGQVHRLTDGLFDPTVQPLWKALADGGDVATAREAIGWNRVAISSQRIRLGRSQALTLNGVAQGYAADRVRKILEQSGFGQVLVDLGEFAAIGGPWDMAVTDPTHGQVARRRLSDGAIATSSPAALALSAKDTHILGPGGQAPRWSTISVEAESAAWADALSTALCLANVDLLRRPRDLGARRIVAVDLNGDASSF